MDALSFLLAEEAINRNKATIKFQEYLALMIWERARIELAYVKGLNEWSKQIAKDGKDYLEDQVYHVVSDILPTEAEMTSSLHQKLYNMLMEDAGPYTTLYRYLKHSPHRDCRSERACSPMRQLSEIEEEFNRYNNKKVLIELENRKRQTSIDETQIAIQAQESKMASRSRLAVVRRSAKGHRKVDNMMKRLSDMRKRVETDTNEIRIAESELANLFQSKKMEVQNIVKELEILERRRLYLIFEQLMKFIEKLQSIDYLEESDRRKNVMRDVIDVIRCTKVDEIFETEWKSTERKASARKAGAVFSLQEFIKPEDESGEQPSHEEPLTRSAVNFMDDCPSACRAYTPRVRSMADNLMTGANVLDIRDNENGLHCIHNMVETSSEESLDVPVVVQERPMTQGVPMSSLSGSSCGSKIETIFIPPEEQNKVSRLPPPFPAREFCPSLSEEEEEEEKYPMDIGMSEVMQFDSDTGSLSMDGSCEDLALMRDVRLIANHDYTARKSDELTFQRGQIIKQKVGENDEGYAYGWIRETRIGQKQYGWYPTGLMSLYQPNV